MMQGRYFRIEDGVLRLPYEIWFLAGQNNRRLGPGLVSSLFFPTAFDTKSYSCGTNVQRSFVLVQAFEKEK